VQLWRFEDLWLIGFDLLGDEELQLAQPFEEPGPVDHQIAQHRQLRQGRDPCAVLEPGGAGHSRSAVQLDRAQPT